MGEKVLLSLYVGTEEVVGVVGVAEEPISHTPRLGMIVVKA